MRVLCIDTSPSTKGTPPEIEEGSVYTVVDTKVCSGIPHYKLAECLWLYGTFRFISCSDQDNLVLEDVLVETNNKSCTPK